MVELLRRPGDLNRHEVVARPREGVPPVVAKCNGSFVVDLLQPRDGRGMCTSTARDADRPLTVTRAPPQADHLPSREPPALSELGRQEQLAVALEQVRGLPSAVEQVTEHEGGLGDAPSLLQLSHGSPVEP